MSIFLVNAGVAERPNARRLGRRGSVPSQVRIPSFFSKERVTFLSFAGFGATTALLTIRRTEVKEKGDESCPLQLIFFFTIYSGILQQYAISDYLHQL